MSAPARREQVRYMIDKGLSKRRSLSIVHMSPSAYRYEPALDRNCVSRKIIALAQRHRRYGAGMIYLKLLQAGELVNHKRVDRLYARAGLQIKNAQAKEDSFERAASLGAAHNAKPSLVYGLCV